MITYRCRIVLNRGALMIAAREQQSPAEAVHRELRGECDFVFGPIPYTINSIDLTVDRDPTREDMIQADCVVTGTPIATVGGG